MRILKKIFLILLILGVGVASIFAIVEMPKRPCEKILVLAHTDNESIVLSQKDVENKLKEAKINIVGERIKDIKLDEIRQMLQKEPYIKEINAIRFSGTQLRIEYTLYSPIMHVFNQNGEQFFLDKNGHMLPYTMKMTDNLFIANGHINQQYAKGKVTDKALLNTLQLANKINQDEFCQAQFRQIYVNEYKELELSSTLGKQNIIFGTMDQADEKLNNLKAVFCNGLTHKGFDQYAQLDARYKNRIIAQYKTQK